MTAFRTSGGTMSAPQQTRIARQVEQRQQEDLARKLFDAAGADADDDGDLPSAIEPSQKAHFADAIGNAWRRGPDARHENSDADAGPPSIEDAWKRGPQR